MTKHPQVKWAETEEALYVTLEVLNCVDPKINVTEDGIEFAGGEWVCNLVLKGKIDPAHEDTKHTSTDRAIEFHLMKAEEGRWNTLLKDKKLGKNLVQADWDKWVDSDDEEKDAAGFDMSQMGGGGGGGGMPGMGGMGGMPGMGGMGGMGGGMPGMGGMGGGMPGMGGMGGMPGMGGMGGMPGMGGAGGMDMAALQEMMKNMPKGGPEGGDDEGGDDEDDDDLPDLEDEDAK